MQTTTATPTRETFVCACAACGSRAITAPAGYISGTPKQVRDLVHSYVSGAYSPVGGVFRAMADRAGIVAA